MNHNKELFEGLEIRPLTKRLINNLALDLPMEAPLIVDFGIVSVDHYRALKAIFVNDPDSLPELEELADDETAIALAYRSEFRKRVQELDAAYGNGPLLDALVRKYAPAYADVVSFETGWDEICGHQEF